jgi:glycosyltransferase involved in cell wall biosynthesis
MPLVSVVIPVFNGEKTILETVNSVLNQTVKDFELIIINDGSIDKTLDLLSNINDPRVRTESFQNAGLATSRNRGIHLSCSKYISFIDADDLWSSDKLELQLLALKNNPKASVVYIWTDFIDESGQFLHPGKRSKVSGDVYRDLFVSNFLESGSNILVELDAIKSIKGFNESIAHAQDWDCGLKLAEKYLFEVVKQVQVFYRQVQFSLSSKIANMEKACLRVIEDTLTRSPQQLKPFRSLCLSNLYFYLTVKSLQHSLQCDRSRNAIRYCFMVIYYNPSFMYQNKILFFKFLYIINIIIIFSCSSCYIFIYTYIISYMTFSSLF